MATQEDFVIVSKKDLEKMNEALSKAKEVIDAAAALIGVGAPPAKKERKSRATKAEMAARAGAVEAPAATPPVEAPIETKAPAKVEKAAAPTKVVPKALGKSPVPPKKANGSFAPSMPKH